MGGGEREGGGSEMGGVRRRGKREGGRGSGSGRHRSFLYFTWVLLKNMRQQTIFLCGWSLLETRENETKMGWGNRIILIEDPNQANYDYNTPGTRRRGEGEKGL